MYHGLTVGAIIPAYNEELAIAQVVSDLKGLKQSNLSIFDDIVVCDNNSNDQTAGLAMASGARVIRETRQGYGSACLAGLNEINQVDIVVFVDGDGSIDVEDIINLLDKIHEGYDFVLGARNKGLAEKGSLLFHQQMGNSLIVSLIQLMWGRKYDDLGPLRAISFNKLSLLDMRDTTYGWTLEMQIKAIWRKLKVYELPVRYRRRIGKSKISGSVKGSIFASCKMLKVLFALYGKQLMVGREKL